MSKTLDIILIDDVSPEDLAMLQALYSRSPKSVREHLEKVRAAGSGKFMDQFYVGYGHASIGDCGSTTLFAEYVSMLAAKAVQDNPLYSGQEASTRYINFAEMPVLDPFATQESWAIQTAWMNFYNSAMEPVVAHLKTRYPNTEGTDEKSVAKYEKAIKARAFDVLRSFLPAGCTTFVAWHSNLRQAADKLATLRHHPLPEMKNIAEGMLGELKTKYPNSFSHKLYEETETYREFVGTKWTYFDPETCPENVVCTSRLDPTELDEVRELITKRPPKTSLPHFLDEIGQVRFDFQLDFGSYRDLQRHRNGVCRMPLLSTRWGFHPWYLEQLPDDVRREAEKTILELVGKINALPNNPEMRQYYTPMGFKVPCRTTRGLPGTLYLIELRAGKTVHPTMRRVAQDMARTFGELHPDIPLHADMDPDDWDIKRGGQDIVAKPSA
jgi:thymidylate synthase ThyX